MSRHGPDPRVPRWASRLLEWVLPPGPSGESIRADLREEFAAWVETDGPRKARLRYGWESIKIALHFVWDSLGRGDGSAGMGGGGTMGQNVKMAVRRAAKSPGFTAVAVATIALGIGANVAIFSVVDAVLLDPLPYEDADDLVAVWEWNRPRDRMNNVANPGNYRAWRDGAESFAAMSAVSMAAPRTVSFAGEADEVNAQFAEPAFFDLLGLDPVAGRLLRADETDAGVSEVILSHRYWSQRFGGDPSIVGAAITVNGAAATVAGVLPAEYVVFGESTDLWVGTRFDRADQTNSGRYLQVLGRLQAGTDFRVAVEEMDAIAASLEAEFPDFNSGWGVNLVPLKTEIVGDVQRALWVLLGSVGMLLLIACANVANLFLVRATARRREMAVRTSLGASGRTLAGQLLTESLLIAGMGALLGVALAHFGTIALAERIPDAFALPRVESAGVSGNVLLFAIALTALTGVAFGLVPALEAARTTPAGMLNAEARGPSRDTGRLRSFLVVAEVAVSVILLAGASLFGRSFIALTAVDPGIEPESVLVGRVNLSGDRYRGDAAKVAFFEELMTELKRSPEVEAVGGVTFLPMDGQGSATSFWPADRPPPDPEDREAADIRNVTGDYFSAMGVDLLRGRVFDERDRADGPQTVVVNRTLAEKHWPGAEAVGKRIIVNWVDHEPWEIVGVVEDVRMAGLDTAPREVVYMSYAKATFFPWMQVSVRARRAPEQVAGTLRESVARLDRELAVGQIRVMADIVSVSTATPRVTAFLMTVFAGLATFLAALGLYGVLAYAVSKRVREIGVRIALGAQPRDVLGLVAAQGTRLVLVGVVLGLLGAVAGGSVLSALLFEISPNDPVALAASGVVLCTVAVVACLIPAWRAVRVAPVEALRAE